MIHFFISHNRADRFEAEWIAREFEEAGYMTILQAWDFLLGSNFVLAMQKATEEVKHTVTVLSPAYLPMLYTQSEWAAAFAQDPPGEQARRTTR